MHPEAAFLAGYAVVLVAAAAGLESLGRRSSSPWASRMLAASRPPEVRLEDKPDWPHSEVPVFHLGVSAVILAAGLVLTIVSMVRHHRPVELVLQLAVLALIATRLARMVSRHRADASAGRQRGR